MAKGFSINELISAIQYAVVEAQEVAENQHTRQIAEYFTKEGEPVTIPLKIPNPDPRAGEKDASGKEVVPSMVEVDIPKITLVPQNSIVLKELEVEMEVPIGNLAISEADPAEDELKKSDELSNEQWQEQKMERRLGRRSSKRAMVDRLKQSLMVSGKGSFFGGNNKKSAKIRIRFEGGEPPEVVARIEQSLVKLVDT
ncbi:MAG: DUF2589 domain-containing protein [Desulfobacterales bacterium]|nr:DUF2589 domain-containing protein [Desulfobacterales bacterium]